MALGAIVYVLYTMLLSAVPLLELRVGIPYGVANGLHPAAAALAGIVGNLVQVPLILAVLVGLRRLSPQVELLTRFFAWTDRNARKQTHFATKYGWLGIGIIVALPIPGTGLWTGAVVGHILGLPIIRIALGMALGVIVSGTVLGLASAGVLELLGVWGVAL